MDTLQSHGKSGVILAICLPFPSTMEGMFVMFQRKKKRSGDIDCSQSYVYGEEIARKRTQKGDYMTVR